MASDGRLLWIVGLAASAIYAANLWDPLLGDDFDLIRSFYGKPFSYFVALLWSNESGEVWTHFGLDPAKGFGYLRPLKIWLLALDHAVWGGQPFGFHLTSTACYVGVVVGTAALARESLPARLALAAAGSIAVAMHPVFAEVVPFVTAREETLGAALVIAALLTFVRSRDGRSSPFLFAALLGMALAVKESAICLVGLAACHDLAHGRLAPDRLRETVRAWWPATAVLCVYFGLRWAAFGNPIGGGGHDAHYASWDALRFFPRMLGSLGDPTLLSVGALPGARWVVALAAAAPILALALLWRRIPTPRRRDLLFFGPLWFLATTALYAGIPFATRHHVLPVVGLGLFGTLALATLLDAGVLRGERRVAVAVLASGLFLFLPSSCTTSLEYAEASRAVARIRGTIADRTADLPDGSVVSLHHVPQWTLPPYYFGWSLLAGLQKPFAPSDVAGRLTVVNTRYRELNDVKAPAPDAFDRVVEIGYSPPRWIRARHRQRVLRDYVAPGRGSPPGTSPARPQESRVHGGGRGRPDPVP